MKLTLLYLLFFVFNLPKQPIPQPDINFTLEYVCIGFGSNMWEMQPIFRIKGTKFVYTSEEVWRMPDQTEIKRDTLLKGDFRPSAIDSIKYLINPLKDSVIDKANLLIMSGVAISIRIDTDEKKMVFNLHNAPDTTAKKIVAIINSHIPAEHRKLPIFYHERNRRRNQTTSTSSY